MSELLHLIQGSGYLWSSLWDERPAKLFDGVDQQLCIHLLNMADQRKSYLTRMNHWATECRTDVFKTVDYVEYNPSFILSEVNPKIQSAIELSITNKISKDTKPLATYQSSKGFGETIYYRRTGGRYWKLIKSYPTYFLSATCSSSTTENQMTIESEYAKGLVSILSSSLFYWYWRIVSNCRDVTNRELFNFPVSIYSIKKIKELRMLTKEYEADLEKNKKRVVTNSERTGEIVQDFYFARLSKPIVDKIDTLLAEHYGFTPEELDFIINYDIKYRMGDELN